MIPPNATIICGNALDELKKLPTGSVHEGITSSPYLGLRCYGTEPIIWGGDPNCNHEWDVVHPPGYRGSDTNPGPLQHQGNKNREKLTSGFCKKCGAWRGELGLEPTPELFVEHLVMIFREFKRVLRDDGVLWVNMGDSYASAAGKGGSGTPTGRNGRGEDYQRPQGMGECKPKDLMEIPSMLAAALRDDGWYLRARIPWIKRNCLGGGTVVYTKAQKGVMPMLVKDLARGKPGSISVWNGSKWTRVIDVHRSEQRSGLTIEFRDGTNVTSTKEHRWPVVGKGLLPALELTVSDVIETTILPDSPNNPVDLSGVCSAVKGGELHDIWRGQVRFDLTDRRTNSTCFKLEQDSEIVSITPSRDQTFYGIGVEDEPHLFALGNGVLTHNSLPSSVTDRPGSSIEYVFLLAKSGTTQFWTHPTLPGSRTHPEPDYVYTNDDTKEVTTEPPANWATLFYEKDGKQKHLWKRRNLWEGHDYFYDPIATMQPSSESYNKDKRPRGILRQCVNPESKYPDEGQFAKRDPQKQDLCGNGTLVGFNARYVDANPGLRFMRDSDFFFRTWQGLLHNEDGEPMALVVNPKGYKGCHFACFPVRLPEVMILAGTSNYGVCPKCGAPWFRQSKKISTTSHEGSTESTYESGTSANRLAQHRQAKREQGSEDWSTEFITAGWLPTCSCYAEAQVWAESGMPQIEGVTVDLMIRLLKMEVDPAVVLDMFAGSGTTGVAALARGRKFTGIDLNPDYCNNLATKRLEEGK